jgi:hypothetical protein
MTTELLYIIVVLEILLLLAVLWKLTNAQYFLSLLIGNAVLLPAFFGAYLVVRSNSPEMLHTPVFGKVAPYFQAVLRKAVYIVPIAIAGVIVLATLYFVFVRPLVVKLNEFLYGLRGRMFDSKKPTYKKHEFSVTSYLQPGRYFVGLTQSRKPVHVTPVELTTHLQVVGPSGVGKTMSSLFPLAAQALDNGHSLIFVDGKGDSKLKQLLMAHSRATGVKTLFFDPLQPETSDTYNPLIGSTDPSELTNLLAVGLNLNAPGEAKVYTDIQKKFIANLLQLFIQTGKPFNFVDMLEYINHRESRQRVSASIRDEVYKTEMIAFLSRLSKNEKELIGLATVLDQLFVTDEKISALINTYTPDIRIRDILRDGGAVLFSFSAGMKAQTNEALAKMVLADIANSVGERHAVYKEHPFCLIVLDEFGQYVSESFDKFISTARSANVACVLSHQTNAQLETPLQGDRLARVVRENTSGKIIFRQQEEASFWSETFGTRQTMKRTEQVEAGALGAEHSATMGSLREVDEFIIHPNVFRTLAVGQAVWKFKERMPEVLSFGMYPVSQNPGTTAARPHDRRQHSPAAGNDGLNLREQRVALLTHE